MLVVGLEDSNQVFGVGRALGYTSSCNTENKNTARQAEDFGRDGPTMSGVWAAPRKIFPPKETYLSSRRIVIVLYEFHQVVTVFFARSSLL
jgi:hypothetical protein